MKPELSIEEKMHLIEVLKSRFEKNPNRHIGIEWQKVCEKLEKNLQKIWSLNQMEITGGEPDVVAFDDKTNEFIFFDCAKESPSGRRSFCYDAEALASRKEHKPKYSAMEMATDIGVEILNEDQYRFLQKLGNFDTKTSSWIKTPESIRKLGGALFCDFRFETVFVYHNGAESYYAARGLRACLRV